MIKHNVILALLILPMFLVVNISVHAAPVAVCPAIKTVKYICCKYRHNSVWIEKETQAPICGEHASDCTIAASKTYDDPTSEFDSDGSKWIKLTQLWGKNGCNVEGATKAEATVHLPKAAS